MAIRNSPNRYGSLAQLFHWSTAGLVIAAYMVIYYALWYIPDKPGARLPTLNVHWALGFTAGMLTLLRIFWRSRQVAVQEAPGTSLEHLIARIAHWLLYAFLLLMPITGYLGTRRGIDFGLFYLPSFKETALFEAIARTWGITYAQFEAPLDVVHHAVGKWFLSALICTHVAAALFHHFVRRDTTLKRMLPASVS